MIKFEQKEFVSARLKAAAKFARLGRDTKFWGGYVGGTIGRTARTIGSSIAHPIRTATGVVTGVAKDNVNAAKWAGNTLNTVFNPKSGASMGKRVMTAATTALDFTPGTAAALAVADKARHVAGKTGRDVVRSMAELRYSPVKKIGEEAAILRTSGGYQRMGGLGRKYGGGTWTKGGVNNACLGTAPDRILTHVGDTWQRAQGGAVEREIENFVNSKEGRRLAARYDRKMRLANQAAKKSDEALQGTENFISRGFRKIGSIFRRN